MPVFMGISTALFVGLTREAQVFVTGSMLSVISFLISKRFLPPVPGELPFSKGTKSLVISQ